MNYMKEYKRWLDSPCLSEAEWSCLKEIAENEKEIESRFYAPLEFGTAGLRGIMGVGLNRMNIHVIRWTTQAFAELILSEGEEAKEKGLIICYDCRVNSDVFAKEAASVAAANGIKCRIFDSLRPTPELSFAIRHYGAIAGINVTASHNPKEYSGYKVYWSDGAQLPPQHAQKIADTMSKLDMFKDVKRMPFEEAVQKDLISILGEETDEIFLERVLEMSISSEPVKKLGENFAVVYTPFHGTGYKLIPEVLKRIGVKNIYPEPKQTEIDGTFPTVISPNPEDPEGFYLAIELAEKKDADLIIGTDPDADRIGVLVKHEGEYRQLSGNQIGLLLLDYIINLKRENGTLPENAAVITTIVTSKMAKVMAEDNGIHLDETFTGFKFIAEKIAEYENDNSYDYQLAFEESYGYMFGDFVRDKDAVTAALLITEMAAFHLQNGRTLFDAMDMLYEKHGFFREKTVNIAMEGLEGVSKRRALMEHFRNSPPDEIVGFKVVGVKDYQSGEITVPGLGKVGHTHIMGSDVLVFDLIEGSSLVIRPSGTEPKVKVYMLLSGKSKEELEKKEERLLEFAESLKE